MLRLNGLPPVNVPPEVPSEELFGARVAENVKAAQSMESVRSQVSGFQEEGFTEMQEMTTGRDPRRQKRGEGESIYSKESRSREGSAQRQPRETVEREEIMKTKPKEKRETKLQEIDAKNLGLKIYASESFRFPKKITYDEIVDGVKRGKYKITYTDKRSETEIIALMEKGKMKIDDDDLSVVPDDVFRKVRQGREQTPPSKVTKKPWQK